MKARLILTTFFSLAILKISLATHCFNCTSTDNFDCHANTAALDKESNTCEGNVCLSSEKDGIVSRYCAETITDFSLQFCNSAYCNSVAYAFDCVSCDSTSNPNCKSNVSLVTDTCRSSTCYTSVDSTGKVVRGCVDCSSDTTKTCSQCNNALKCNSDSYASCYECDSTDPDCIEISHLTKIKQCASNEMCYTKLTSSGATERGCSTKELQCNNSSCSTCSGDNCNKEVFPANRLSCLQCHGTDDCNQGSTTGSYCSKFVEDDACFTYANEKDEMIRGCLSDDVGNNCTTTNCEKCNSANCNTLKINERPSKLQCYQCDKDCHVIDHSKLQGSLCKTYPFNAEEKCYTLGDNNTKSVERGCFYDVADIETRCGTGTYCSTCSEENCNDKSVISCYECTDCLNTTNSTNLSQCDAGDFCLSKIDDSNKVIRACSDKKCSSEEENCETCDNDKCNSGVFPNDRISCLQCDSLSETDDCAKGLNSSLELCQIYYKNDKCYLYIDGNNMIHRGCWADIDEKRRNCTAGNHCEECVGSGCNSKSLYQESERKCVQCMNCTKELPEEEKCSSSHFYFEKEECYTQNVTQEGVTVTNRGCLRELKDQECGENCTRCETDGCNKYGDDYQEFPDFKCVVCHNDNGDCEGEPQQCQPIPTTNNEGIGCFVERRGSTIIRDCLTKAGDWNTTLTSKNVLTCKTDSCNVMAAPGSAVIIHLSTGLLVTLIASLFSLNNII